MKLPSGKVPIEILTGIVFQNLGVKREEVTIGPSAGVDGAVIDLGDNSIIVSMDPITGAVERIGWLAVHVNANDIATFGVKPAFFSSCMLLPEDADEHMVQVICSQMNDAALALGVSIIGGHCEVTPGLNSPILVGCMMGFTERGNYVTAAGAKPGDKIILTKSAGIEGTAILATDRFNDLKRLGVGEELLKSAQGFFKKISVVEDGVAAFQAGGVHAMHDPTEGGIIGGLHEMADASKLGFTLLEDKIPVAEETRQVCNALAINPLMLISSGAMLIAAENHYVEEIIKKLQEKCIPSSIIGEFTESFEERVMVRRDGRVEKMPRPKFDHLWLALRKLDGKPKIHDCFRLTSVNSELMGNG